METTIKGLPSEERINKLMAAMSFLSKAKEIIRAECPNQEEIRKNKEFFDAMFEVESNCGDSVFFLSQAIGALIAYDLTEKY